MAAVCDPKLRAFLAAALLAPALLTARPATAEDLHTLRARAQAIADDVSALERRLEGLRGERSALEAELERHTRRIALLELEMRAFQDDYRAASERYVERAVEAYKSGGPGARIAQLLASHSLHEFFTLARATSRASELDSRSLRSLLSARRRAATLQRGLDRHKQGLLAARARMQTLASGVEAALDERNARLEALNGEIERLEIELTRNDRRARSRRSSNQSPQGDDAGRGEAGPPLPKDFVSTGVFFEGLASWYGPGFEGNRTASGEVFDSSRYTAASRELPFGTWLHVTHEGRGIAVVVNDRGPYVGRRILDLSSAAARVLGLARKGVGWIRAEILVKV